MSYPICWPGRFFLNDSFIHCRHSAESITRWNKILYYIYIATIPDLFFVPTISFLFSRSIRWVLCLLLVISSRKQEYEADYMALFLLKRSGYDPSSMITTIGLLDMNKDEEGIISVLSQAINTHPLVDNRVSSLQDNIFKFEKTFQSKYEVSPLPDPSFFHRVLTMFHLALRVSSNKQINISLAPIPVSIHDRLLAFSLFIGYSCIHHYQSLYYS